MSMIQSFEPIVNASARILILGSMPGVVSLEANQYYAHSRNAFWPIMASIFRFDVDATYDNRVESLKASGVALWDVLHACIRTGSLDSAIVTGSRVPNDFCAFFNEHPDIKLVGFNGAEAEKSFLRYVQPKLELDGIEFVRLPSSSPAHAVALDKKIDAWRKALKVQRFAV